jgi:4-alpha-glucanotransferase
MVALEPLVERGWLDDLALPASGFPADASTSRCRPLALDRSCVRPAPVLPSGPRGRTRRIGRSGRARVGLADDYALFMALQTNTRAPPGGNGRLPLRRVAIRWRCPRHAAAGRSPRSTFWTFVQWCFDVQLGALKAHANARRALRSWATCPSSWPTTAPTAGRGRICTTWTTTGSADRVAGVPPDALGPEGQRWGNPLYRWDRMAEDGYAWWVARVRRAMAAGRRVPHRPLPRLRGLLGDPGQSPTALTGRLGARAGTCRCSRPCARPWASCPSSQRTWG